jgi:hypothetical protein
MFQPYQVIIRCDGYMNLELLQLKTISINMLKYKN